MLSCANGFAATPCADSVAQDSVRLTVESGVVGSRESVHPNVRSCNPYSMATAATHTSLRGIGRPFFRKYTSTSAYRNAVSSVTFKTRTEGLFRYRVNCAEFSAQRVPARNPLYSSPRTTAGTATGEARNTPKYPAIHSLRRLPVRRIDPTHLPQRRVERIRFPGRPAPQNSSKSEFLAGLRSEPSNKSKGGFIETDSLPAAGFMNRLLDFRRQVPKRDRHEI